MTPADRERARILAWLERESRRLLARASGDGAGAVPLAHWVAGAAALAGAADALRRGADADTLVAQGAGDAAVAS